MTMTIPGEQQLVFEAADATEFRALLGRILADSPLSCGQISIKTGMPRSTAYSLPDTKRSGLPSNPGQVRDFVKACGLTPTQIEIVMDLWTTLQRQADDTRATEPTDNPAAGPSVKKPSDLDYLTTLDTPKLLEDLKIRSCSDLTSFLDLRDSGWAETGPRAMVFGRRRTSWADLLQYTLAKEERTRRAVMLLIPLTLLLLGIVAALVFLAVKMPAATLLVVAGLLSPLALLFGKSIRHPKKTDN